MKIAFLGIGLMGQPMAANLLNAGYHLTLWNRTQSKTAALADKGAMVAQTPAEAIADADMTITMLESGPVVDQVLFADDTPVHFKAGSTVIDMSSVPPGLAKQHYARLKAIGVDYLDAPVSGGTVGAEHQSLAIMAGGDKAVFERCLPLFNALGKATYIGPAGSGQLAKCANQAIVGITIGAVAEALLLAAEGGADPAAVREALLGGFANSRILELHGQRMIDRAFNPGGTARVQLKDLSTILDTAAEEDLKLPLVQQAFDQYQQLVNNGLEEVDHSGLLLQLEQQNGNRTLNDKPTISPYTQSDHS